MKLAALTILAALLCAALGPAWAVPPGMTVEFKVGNVVFDGSKHAEAGLKCADCHPDIFGFQKGAVKITINDHRSGRLCGSCHDGSVSFAIKDGNCTKCHRLPATEGR